MRGYWDRLVAVKPVHDLIVELSAEEHSPVARDTGIVAHVLQRSPVFDLAAQLLGHHLESNADAEGRHPELQHTRIERRRALLVDRRRTAGEDEGDQVLRLDLRDVTV